VLVYGVNYVSLFCRIVLPNLASLMEEIPPELSRSTRFRVLSDADGARKINGARALAGIPRGIAVDISGDIEIGGFDDYHQHGPMVLAQSRFIRHASREGAGIIFCPPDLIWSRGSFSTIIGLASRGYRTVIGPSARGIKEAIIPILESKLATDPYGKLRLSSHELTGLLFDHWQHGINDGCLWNVPHSNDSKAYSYYRVGPRQLLMRFHQGPTMFAWPYRMVPKYMGWIDHHLATECARANSEVYVVEDAQRLMTLDLVPRAHTDGIRQTTYREWDLFKQLLRRKDHSDLNVNYGKYTCRIYDAPLPEADWRRAERKFDSEVLPAIYLAQLVRMLRRFAERPGPQQLVHCIRELGKRLAEYGQKLRNACAPRGCFATLAKPGGAILAWTSPGRRRPGRSGDAVRPIAPGAGPANPSKHANTTSDEIQLGK
jgi:hypothetical protein